MYLITGGNSDIGRPLASQLMESGQQVTVLTRDSWDMTNPLADIPTPNTDIKYIVHCADVSRKMMPDSPDMLAANMAITDNLLKLWNKYPAATMITFQSLLAYDYLINGEIQSTTRFCINPNNPNQYYAKSKQYLQQAIVAQRNLGRDGKVLLLGNCYGQVSHNAHSNIISDLVKQLPNGKIHLRSTGLEKRSFMHYQDLFRCINVVKDIREIGLTGLPVGSTYSIRQVVEMMDSLVTAEIGMTYEEVTYPNRTVSMDEPITKYWNSYFPSQTPLLLGLSSMLKENGIS